MPLNAKLTQYKLKTPQKTEASEIKALEVSSRFVNEYLLKLIEKKDTKIKELNKLVREQNISSIHLKTISSIESSHKRVSSGSLETLKFRRMPKNFKYESPDKKHRGSKYYEQLKAISEKANRLKRMTSESFLNKTNRMFDNSLSNPLILELKELVSDEDNFAEKIKFAYKFKLVDYSNTIRNLIEEHRDALSLIKRMKSIFLLNDKVAKISEFSSKATILTKNVSRVLDCESARIYTVDPKTNNLVLHTDKELKENVALKKGKDGISIVLKTGQPMRIEDARSDNRFNSQVDDLIGFETKNAICAPLFNSEGEIVGAIEALNKNERSFGTDDEELLEILATQAAFYFECSPSSEVKVSLYTKLKTLLIYSQELMKSKEKQELEFVIVELLQKLFNTEKAKITIGENEEKGLIGESIRRKEIIIAIEGMNDVNFNSLVDIETSNRIVTIPLLGKRREVLGAAQFEFTGELNDKTRCLKKSDEEILDFVSGLCCTWMKENEFN